MNGRSPHKLYEMELEQCLKKIVDKENILDVFDINKIKWKHLDNGE